FKSLNAESNAAASDVNKIVDDVVASVKASETLGLEKSKSGKNLGKYGLNATDDVDTGVEASTKDTDETVVNSHSDERMKTISGDKEDFVPVDQGKNDDNDVVNIDDH
ncbi:hypothetical protein A2U01_0059279, partial [Trifolium medium]|nr:hypothetical protein [Trifolium medium]